MQIRPARSQSSRSTEWRSRIQGFSFDVLIIGGNGNVVYECCFVVAQGVYTAEFQGDGFWSVNCEAGRREACVVGSGWLICSYFIAVYENTEVLQVRWMRGDMMGGAEAALRCVKGDGVLSGLCNVYVFIKAAVSSAQ